MAGSSEKDRKLLAEHKNVEWLIGMTNRSNPNASSKPQIGRVPSTLREISTNKGCFDPLVVSLGPYHHDKECVKPMEPCKGDAARWFISFLTSTNLMDPESANDDWDYKVRQVYDNFVSNLTNLTSKPTHTRNNPIEATLNSTLKELYAADETIDKLKGDDLAIMMFLDGCFILYFINLVNKSDDLMDTHPNLPMIVRDMFLLENQVPYVVLKALMSLKPNQDPSNQSDVGQRTDIEKFIKEMFLPPCESLESLTSRLYSLVSTSWQLGGRSNDHKIDESNSMESNDNPEPLHLLDFLRKMFIGGPVTLSSKPCKYYFRSIMELKTAGIKLCRSHSSHLQEIKFKKSFFNAHLSLPQMIVDDETKTWLLNLIAYEMCLERPPDSISEITSYICFLDSLIDHAEDVKEFRSKDILLNRLGSDKEVAKLFNELANNLMPHPRLFSDTMEKIESHCKNRSKVWFAEMLHTHFSSPWTVISLIVVIFLSFFTVIQTIFTVWPR